MSAFRCRIVEPDGAIQWRTIEARDATAAAGALAARGIVALDIREGRPGFIERLSQPVHLASSFSGADQALLLTRLSVLVSSGLPVDRSLDLLRDQASRARQRRLLDEMVRIVRAGEPLSQALEQTNVFPSWVVGVVRAAEQSGGLGQALLSLADQMKSATRTRQQLITSLTYPTAVLAATVLALVIVLLVVIPQFKPVFAGQEDRLPALTQAVLTFSTIVDRHGFLIALSAMILVAGIIAAFRSDAARAHIARTLPWLPGLGLRNQYLAARFAGLMATLLESGIMVPRALLMTGDAIGSARWKSRIRNTERKVREGATLTRALQREGFLPSTIIRLLEVGEQTGSLVTTCKQAGLIVGEIVQARIERLVSLASPAAIVLLGGIVAALVGGVMLGVFSIGGLAE